MKTAMILAAGRGERLRPLTDKIPKAMCEVHGIPLIEYHVINLVRAGFTRLVVNHAYLGGQIRQHLGNGARFNVEICYSPEPPGGLETAGGIVNALPLLGKQPFLTVNADTYTDFDFKTISLEINSNLHVILVKKNRELGHMGDFGLLRTNQLSNTPRDYTYAGIAVYQPQIFEHAAYGRYSLVSMMRFYAEEGQATGEVYCGNWFDIGSIARLRAANKT